ncbi:hypothetical protein [Novosphingobium sp. PASSN1]|uniref:linalool dehydratase/isomerase domain-containing protein n=1 Tax=Novosphingobium sp. PASSN1 TaxID=2015561 RepID=UPI000BCD22B3|nr:hypothetical protein [Novosphingobium sp. PASSN1]OYU36857.1 MAG: hypothetical protein CFE35_00185 [Novosphingobium sp. PASSN1]
MATQAIVDGLLDGSGAAKPIVAAIPPIPERLKPNGPLTAYRIRRFQIGLTALFLAGLAPVLLGMSAQWQAFGLGLIFPGGGFLYAGGVVGVLGALVSLACFAVITFIWWARGVILGPPGVLVGTALLSAAWIEGGEGVSAMAYLIPAGTGAIYGYLGLQRRRRFAEQQARGKDLNVMLAKAEPVLREAPIEASPEMTDGQILEYRRMLDLALQPVDSWSGFTTNDTWQDGALRYQISTMSWNLAFGQYTQLPAFHGYLNTAQENLIRKHIDRKTWNYWFWESLWGNFQISRNPVEIDNIMLSGFLGVSLGLFETASGTSPFAAPGELTFRWDERTAFPYNHEGLLKEVQKNYQRYDLGWFPCEPRWVYSMCNLVGRTSLALHDARHGTNLLGPVHDRFEQTMTEEMMMADGRIKVCTSTPFGFQVPSLSGLFGETWGIRFLTPHAPEQAERLWQVLKQDFIKTRPDGSLDFKLLPLGWDTRKPANFSFDQWPEMNPLTMVLWSALEMGDEEIIAATRAALAERNGADLPDMLTWTRRNTVRDMVNKGLPEAWKTGPLLTRATYPEVLVTRAVSDGQALELVLRAGGEPVRTELGFGRLKPGRGYRVVETGQALIADAQGQANILFDLDKRSQLTLVPVI